MKTYLIIFIFFTGCYHSRGKKGSDIEAEEKNSLDLIDIFSDLPERPDVFDFRELIDFKDAIIDYDDDLETDPFPITCESAPYLSEEEREFCIYKWNEGCEEGIDYNGIPCAEGWICCRGICVNPKISSSNCGGCGRICPYPMRCENGRCVDPPEGMLWCKGAWADPKSPYHCGSCGNLCPEGADCIDPVNGTCSWTEEECPEGDGQLCGSGCFKTERHCCVASRCCDCDNAGVSSVNESNAYRYADYSDNGEPGEYRRLSCETGDNLGMIFPEDVSMEGEVYPPLFNGCGRISNSGYKVLWFGEYLDRCPDGFVPFQYFIYFGDTSGYQHCRCERAAWPNSGFLYCPSGLGPEPGDIPCGNQDSWVICTGSGNACIDGQCTCMPPYKSCNVGPIVWHDPDSPIEYRCMLIDECP